MIARIMVRERLGRKPTDHEIRNQIEVLRENSAALPPLETIAAAFENGEEVRPSLYSHSGHQLARTTENVPVETRVRKLRRKSTAGDRYRLPAPRKGKQT